ncbi:PREDICTED: synaptic vesicle glycoprotein 2C-like [Papilio polytes]|uniref:synaptic vesicle glycoprotein 2C-like n=1 Tax=Papilio polytes TaxID=76194 RepID=UPI00067655ED|nr:PREDICTED: synaptic vesicle glycoprotein 2C-like [Papilio polytes]XP_013137720.1 PREDICTED: synaptic vesicle glycoprotein 2C-like [Papilio polytes]XP_013137721.1 PREDICTED: synaptic vesicle glycoprotein 2C-like [Papilio polytes]
MKSKGKYENDAKAELTVTLDEAMTLTGFGVYNISHMLLSGLILMGVILQNLALGYVLPAAQCDLHLSLQQRGWLAAIPFLAVILTSYFWGWLADTRGRRPVMLFSMVVSVVMSTLASFAPDIISFAVLEFLSAIFMSGSTAVVYTYLGEFNNLRHRDKMVAFGSSFVGIGTVVLPGISWLILPHDFALPIPFLGIAYRSWRLLIVACAVPYFISSILLIFAPESPKFLYSSGQYDKCLKVLKSIYAINKWMPADNYPVKALVTDTHSGKCEPAPVSVLKSMRDQTAPLFRPPLLPWTTLACFVQFGIFATTNGFYVWFPTILNSLANHGATDMRICDILDASKASVLNETVVICDDTMNTATFERSIYIGLVFCSMYLIVGFVVDLVGKKMILVSVLSVTGVCGIGANLAANQHFAVVLFAIFQMSGACIGLMNAVNVELFPTKYRAMAICLSMMMGRVGSMVGSNLIGLFLETNCGASFYLFGGIIIVCAVLCLTLPNKKREISAKKQTEEPAQNETHEPV